MSGHRLAAGGREIAGFGDGAGRVFQNACILHAFLLQMRYRCGMGTAVVQVRDLPEEVVATLKARAESRGQSLTAYLRDLLTQEAAMPPVEDVMAGIASREPVSYSMDDLRSFARDGRR